MTPPATPITDAQILALRAEYLAERNLSGVDTCDVALGRHGASRSPRRVARARGRCAQAHAAKKTSKQLDAEIAEMLANYRIENVP